MISLFDSASTISWRVGLSFYNRPKREAMAGLGEQSSPLYAKLCTFPRFYDIFYTHDLRKSLPRLTPTELGLWFIEVSKQKKIHCFFDFLIDIPTLGSLTEEHLPEIYRYIEHPDLKSVFEYSIRDCKTFDELLAYWRRSRQCKEIEEVKTRILEDVVESGPYTYHTISIMSQAFRKGQLRSLIDQLLPMFSPDEVRMLLRRVIRLCKGTWQLKLSVYEEMSAEAQFVVCEKMFTGKRCLHSLETEWRARHPGQTPPQKQRRKRDESPKRDKLRPQLKNKTPRSTVKL